jgi:hypothetical protein
VAVVVAVLNDQAASVLVMLVFVSGLQIRIEHGLVRSTTLWYRSNVCG